MTSQRPAYAGPSERSFSRVGVAATVSGLVIYFMSALLHPGTPPHETEAAFADYASEPNWAFIHLGEFFGFLLFTAAALALAWRLRRGIAGTWATLAGLAMVISASVYAVFTAVDGVALGIMVERWAGADVGQQQLLYETAFAVRQIEAGLFALQWLMFGVAAGLFACAFFSAAKTPFRSGWLSVLGWLSVIACIGTVSFAVVQADTGFSETSMAFQTGLYPPVVWLVAVAVFLYRHPEADHIADGPARQDDRAHGSRPAESSVNR